MPPETGHDDAVPAGHGEWVLVIEDDEAVGELVVTMLDNLGYRVKHAADSATARAVLDSGSEVDIVLADVVLADGTRGTEFVTEARRNYPGLKAIFMSGYAAGGEESAGLPGFDDRLLNKPFQRGELASALRDTLG